MITNLMMGLHNADKTEIKQQLPTSINFVTKYTTTNCKNIFYTKKEKWQQLGDKVSLVDVFYDFIYGNKIYIWNTICDINTHLHQVDNINYANLKV